MGERVCAAHQIGFGAEYINTRMNTWGNTNTTGKMNLVYRTGVGGRDDRQSVFIVPGHELTKGHKNLCYLCSFVLFVFCPDFVTQSSS